ncbi:MAG: TetR/AcrR family transcriptional regulator [Pseudonocardia sp.]|nr:TetR/AcrR family transcriptional regulator [Pseudonocardia sp.]
MPDSTLRERKRERTRRAVVDAATELFERNGYHGTTVADIAAAADIGTRTFFSYFASKEELLFPEADARIQAVIGAIADRRTEDGPIDVLLRALRGVDAAGHDLVGPGAALRTHLIRTVPTVRGRALQRQLDAQREIARRLRDTYPDQLDDVSSGALVGAFIGAVTGAVQALTDRATDTDEPHTPQQQRKQMIVATEWALQPWSRP